MNHNNSVGSFGEKIAEEFLIRKGYKVIEKNCKTSYKELDLIAFHQETLVFVEVKTRASNRYGFADEMMSDKKLQNIRQAAMIYLGVKKTKHARLRFDFISVDIDKFRKKAKIKHYKDVI